MQEEYNVIPIIRLWGQLLVPLQGDITDEQIDRLRMDVLQLIEKSDPRGLVIDVSGLHLLDSYLCGVIASLAGAARLMGVNTVLSGLSPEIAITLQTMGVDFGQIKTTLSLEDALEIMGIHIVFRSAERRTHKGEEEKPRGAAT